MRRTKDSPEGKRTPVDGEKLRGGMVLALYTLMGILFFPVLFCVIFVGNHMDYNDGLKLQTLRPNVVLFLVALLGIAAFCFLALILGKVRLDAKKNMAVSGILAALFVLLYFANVRIAKEIIFELPWDIMIVRSAAGFYAQDIPLGYQYYFSVYTNNLPIAYILGWLWKKAAEIKDYPYVHEFLWIQVNCALISLGGFFSCLTVKKLTRKLAPTAAAFLLYLALAGMSPWKIAPYTDTYGMLFPVLCVYFYCCYRDAGNLFLKYLYAALALGSGMAGGFIKPSVYVVVIALLGVEIFCLFREPRKNWKYVAAELLLAAGLLFARGSCMDHVIQKTGLDFNPEIEAGWQNYFMMGLNEESTGSYHADDVTIFGEYDTDKAKRNEAALERAFARMRDRGVGGSVYFWLRKMVMTFNDGTFGWETEVWIHEPYPQELAANNSLTEFLRNIFWSDMVYTGAYNTCCQLAWIFCLLGLPGICLIEREQREKYLIFVVSFLGIFLYQMLFEARARYLFVFLPVIIAVSACGMEQYAARVREWRVRRKGGGAKEENREAQGDKNEVGKSLQ